MNCLAGNPWPEIKWGESDRPAILVDGQLYSFKGISANRVSGKCAYVVGTNHKNIEAICSFLNVESLQLYDMRVKDLAPLTRISDLKHLAIRWNTKASSIDPIGEINAIETLILDDTPKIASLEPLRQLKNLTHLEVSGGIWNKNNVKSLRPLSSLAKLHSLTLLNLKIADDSLRPLAKCRSLRELHISNQFPTEEYAFLAVNMPSTKCDKFTPYIRLTSPLDGKDIMVVGRRKPFLNSQSDIKKLEKYGDRFNQLKRDFASDK